MASAREIQAEKGADELASLEREIHESVADLSTLATEVEQGVRGSVRDIKRELRQASKDVRQGDRTPWAGAAFREPGAGPAFGQPGPGSAVAAELERQAAQLLAEVRRLTRGGRAGEETLRAASVVVDTALGQIRRLLR